MENYTIKQRHIMEAVIVNLSILFHQHNTEWEKTEIRKNMEDLISSMDKNGIPWKLQNSLFFVGEKYDVRSCYVSDLCKEAYSRVYAWHVIQAPSRPENKKTSKHIARI